MRDGLIDVIVPYFPSEPVDRGEVRGLRVNAVIVMESGLSLPLWTIPEVFVNRSLFTPSVNG